MDVVVNFFRRVWSWLKIRVLWLIDFISGEERVCEKDLEGNEYTNRTAAAPPTFKTELFLSKFVPVIESGA
ncbi:hypothetical protein Y032_0324g2537 [Ancylostoma ceylanicum]|uniref:Uncharacterized protein n=1 Tax=Ancylostoma ceylanicum TaxID=53326 RepID=A0A016S0A3_9BILA|nr:hypothetical protein Y032_0324g2537 [Ancylostoma ceylanicum]